MLARAQPVPRPPDRVSGTSLLRDPGPIQHPVIGRLREVRRTIVLTGSDEWQVAPGLVKRMPGCRACIKASCGSDRKSNNQMIRLSYNTRTIVRKRRPRWG